MNDINPDILKTAACILRTQVLELYSLEDDSELRAIFEPVGGIETGIKILTLLNGQVDAWAQLFKSIDDNFVHSNTESIQVDFNGNNVHFKTYNK
jgi:hypothetical protein